MNHRMHATSAGFALVASGVLIVGSAVTATATQGHSKPSICHPVEGNGQTGYGWNLIRPDEASKHIDEKTGAGKHTRKDGRTDVYADAAGHCPGWVAPTPKPSHTVSPKPSPTATVPAPSPSVTVTVPVPTPTETTPEPEPSVTVTEPTPTPTETVTSPAPAPTVTDTKPAPTPSLTPTTSSTSIPAPVTHRKPPTPTNGVQVTELAQTGGKLNIAAFGLMLLALGAGLVAFARNLKGGANR